MHHAAESCEIITLSDTYGTTYGLDLSPIYSYFGMLQSVNLEPYKLTDGIHNHLACMVNHGTMMVASLHDTVIIKLILMYENTN